MGRLTKVSALVLLIALLSGCTASRAFRRGEGRARVGDWDAAVTYYRTAVQASPDRPEYRIALERAMLNASRVHFDNARALEAKDQLDAALGEYRRTVEFDPGNTQALDRIIQLEKTIRDRAEAARPKSAIALLREQARQISPAPLLNPASRAPLDYNFKDASLRSILTFIGSATGINVIYDASFNDRPVTATLQGSIEQVLNTLLSSNGLFYTVLDERTIVIAQDSAPNRLKYERQVAITIPLSYADATELAGLLTTITRTTTGVTIPPVILPNKTNNSILVRATEPVLAVIRELVLTNDKPRAEVTIDVEILEVSRSRTKELGLNLSQNQIGGIFSPEKVPTVTSTGSVDVPPFNVNTISQGVSTADFYLTVPAAIVKFLQSDINTRVLNQTQLRGSEGAQLTLKVGADEPYLTTSFSPIAGGGANVNPLSSYTFRTVGINVQATPRLVTDEGDILLDLIMSNDTLGPPRLVGGQLAPSFPTRSVTTKLRLRDGESHLLAGLLQDDERRSMTGFPGIMSIPFLRNLFSATNDEIAQTDIVMLLTPRIIRTHEYTARDLAPIFVGTNQNFGLTGPPPLIATPPVEPETVPAPGVAPQAPAVPPQGLPVPTAPPGGTPGQVTSPAPAAPTTLQPPPTTLQPQGQIAPPIDPAEQRNLTAPTTTTLAPPAQISVTAPAGEVRVAAGPYMVPIYATSVSRASTVTLTVTYNPAVLRMRTVQEGSFLRQAGTNVVFTPNTDAAIGRVDLAFVRTGDKVGASGSGLLAALQFDAVGAGSSQLTVSGTLTNPTGGPIPVQFVPATVVVR